MADVNKAKKQKTKTGLWAPVILVRDGCSNNIVVRAISDDLVGVDAMIESLSLSAKRKRYQIICHKKLGSVGAIEMKNRFLEDTAQQHRYGKLLSDKLKRVEKALDDGMEVDGAEPFSIKLK